MGSQADLLHCPGKLSKEQFTLRSTLCTSQQLALLKKSPEFQQWCRNRRDLNEYRQKAGLSYVTSLRGLYILLGIVLTISFTLLGLLTRSQVSFPQAQYVYARYM